MHHRAPQILLASSLVLSVSGPAAAQHVPFERSYTVPADAVLDVSTIRGTIDVVARDGDRVIVTGTATVRLGFNVPANAVDLAKQVAANPPVQQEGRTVHLRPPAGADERRAVTISYEVTVPRGTSVKAVSDSGATVVRGVAGRVSVQTQSSSIELSDLRTADVSSGSGSVAVDGVAGELRVTTQSGAIRLHNVGADLHVRTQSGSVDATLVGRGDVAVETASSGIDLSGVHGGLFASSGSGRIRVAGGPTAPWQITSGSGSFDIALARDAKLNLDARSRSGSVHVDDLTLDGSMSKGLATGTIGGGGPLVRADSRSGSVRIAAAR